MLGGEKWRGFHSRAGASNGEMNVVDGVKAGARVGWLERPIAGEEEEETEGLEGEKELCVEVDKVEAL